MGIHHIVVNDWERGGDADQNVVLVSVPSVLSPDLAPPGKHVLHAYMPGTEPFGLWKGLDRRSDDYKKLKAERSEVFLHHLFICLVYVITCGMTETLGKFITDDCCALSIGYRKICFLE